MGEARRRGAAAKANGKPDERQDKPRKGGVVHGGTIAADKLVVPPDHLAITFSWSGNCSSIVVALADVGMILAGVEKTLKIKPVDRGDLFGKHVRYRRAAIGELEAARDVDADGSAMGVVLWLAFEHPLAGRRLRAAIAESVQEGAPARLCVEAHPGGRWAFCVAGGYIPMGELLDHAERCNLPPILYSDNSSPRGPLQ